MPSPQYRAFTLIELLVVITIIVVLLALLVPALDRAMLMTDVVRCGANLHLQYVATYQYSTAHKSGLPPVNSPGTHDMSLGGYRTRNFSGGGTPRNPTTLCNLAFLWKNKYAPAGQALFCPGQQNPIFTYKSHSDPVFPTDYAPAVPVPGVVDGSPFTRSSYNHNPIAVSGTNRLRKYRKFSQLDHKALLGVDLIEGHRNPTDISHIELEGFNTSLGEGSVRFVVEPEIVRLIPSGPSGTNYVLWDNIMDRLVNPR